MEAADDGLFEAFLDGGEGIGGVLVLFINFAVEEVTQKLVEDVEIGQIDVWIVFCSHCDYVFG